VASIFRRICVLLIGESHARKRFDLPHIAVRGWVSGQGHTSCGGGNECVAVERPTVVATCAVIKACSAHPAVVATSVAQSGQREPERGFVRGPALVLVVYRALKQEVAGQRCRPANPRMARAHQAVRGLLALLPHQVAAMREHEQLVACIACSRGGVCKRRIGGVRHAEQG
jgi:hypothetical protein